MTKYTITLSSSSRETIMNILYNTIMCNGQSSKTDNNDKIDIETYRSTNSSGITNGEIVVKDNRKSNTIHQLDVRFVSERELATAYKDAISVTDLINKRRSLWEALHLNKHLSAVIKVESNSRSAAEIARDIYGETLRHLVNTRAYERQDIFLARKDNIIDIQCTQVDAFSPVFYFL